MSIKSYQKNVERGVAGAELPVCFPAALEQMSSKYGYRPQVYSRYTEFIEWYSTLSKEERRDSHSDYEDILEAMVRPLGGLAIDDLVIKKINTVRGLESAVNVLSESGHSIVVDIRYGGYNPERTAHSVGIVPVQKGYVTLVSTHVPRALQGIIPIATIGERLSTTRESPIPGHPLHTANFVAFPNV